MKKSKNKKKSLLLILLLLVVGISIGYAALATTLNINGNTIIEKASWDIHFENLVKNTGSETATTEASIDGTKTLIEYTVTLPKPGDYYEFTVDIVNNGTIDAMISEVLKEGLTTDQEKYIEYTAEYSGGVELQEKDFLKAGEKDNIRVKVKYRDDISAAELPTEETTLNLKFQVTYIQADESAVERTKFVCRRATELHTAECTATDESNFCSASGYTTTGSKGTTTITYGNLGTKGAEPVSGDAFDCDVNGDGNYDSETERFYYISRLDSDDSYGVLIYYSNVANGVASDVLTLGPGSVYNDENNVYLGPKTAIKELPTTSDWSNVTLSKNIRNIPNQNGDIIIKNFSYENFAARFITFNEVQKTCNITNWEPDNYGELDNCVFLLENTNFAPVTSFNAPLNPYNAEINCYWIESVYFSDSSAKNHNMAIGGFLRSVIFAPFFGDKTGVRPVIEVPISNILY